MKRPHPIMSQSSEMITIIVLEFGDLSTLVVIWLIEMKPTAREILLGERREKLHPKEMGR